MTAQTPPRGTPPPRIGNTRRCGTSHHRRGGRGGRPRGGPRRGASPPPPRASSYRPWGKRPASWCRPGGGSRGRGGGGRRRCACRRRRGCRTCPVVAGAAAGKGGGGTRSRRCCVRRWGLPRGVASPYGEAGRKAMAAQTERRGRWAGWLNGAARPLAAQRGCGEAVGGSERRRAARGGEGWSDDPPHPASTRAP